MALLALVGALAFPVLGMPAATLVERWPKQRVMVAMDLGRMLAIGTVPLLASLHRLNLAVLVAAAAAVAAMSVFHDIAYQSHLPAIVPADRLGEGNTKLELSNTAAQSIGPALGGVLMHALSGPIAIALNAFTYLCSALALGRIDARTVRVFERPPRQPFAQELAAGVRFIVETPRLGRIALCTATMNFAGAMANVVSLLFLYRTLHLHPMQVGLVFALSNFGFAGALLAIRCSERFGLMATLSSSVLLNGAGRLLLPIAGSVFPVGGTLASLMVSSLAAPIYNVTQLSYRQSVTPLAMQARMHAAMRTVNSATAPLGALAGGVFAPALGTQHTLALAGLITACASLWFVPIAARTPLLEAHRNVPSAA